MGRVAAGRGDALVCALISGVHLAPAARRGRRGAARAGGRAPRAARPGARRGARTYPEARARAPALLHVHLDCRGAGDGTTSPHPVAHDNPSPPAPRRRPALTQRLRLGERGGGPRRKGPPVAAAAGEPRALRSDVNRLRRSPPATPPRASPEPRPAETLVPRLRPGVRSRGRAVP